MGACSREISQCLILVSVQKTVIEAEKNAKNGFYTISSAKPRREPYLALLMTVSAGHRSRQVAIYVSSMFYDLARTDSGLLEDSPLITPIMIQSPEVNQMWTKKLFILKQVLYV
jgi:hypothetical protein